MDDAQLVAALRAGDERAFSELVAAWSPAMKRLARSFVGSSSLAEDVVQEAWLGVLGGIDGFEGRSSLKTWVFQIVANRARTRATREARSVPFSSFAGEEEGGPTVAPERFLGPSSERPGAWAAAPASWGGEPERKLLAGEATALVAKVIERLPPSQRQVIVMRDVEGFSSEEVCDALDISQGNQRVLLHRARAAVRQELEDYL